MAVLRSPLRTIRICLVDRRLRRQKTQEPIESWTCYGVMVSPRHNRPRCHCTLRTRKALFRVVSTTQRSR